MRARAFPRRRRARRPGGLTDRPAADSECVALNPVEGSDDDGEDGGPGGSSWVMAEDLDGPGAEERAAALARLDAMLQDPRLDGPA